MRFLNIFFLLYLYTWSNMNPESNQDKSWDLQSSWIISPGQAKSILQKSGSVFLDSRGLLRRIQVHIPNSITVQWEDFSESSLPLKGHLLPKEKIASLLNKLNLKEESWIVVVGAGSDGWGEEGRIVWSLREMGYRKSYWINGGDTAFMKDSTKGIIPIAEIQNKDEYSFSISKESIQRSLNSEKFILIDTREEREYKGATPYGESRGGHIPGSKWIYFKDFINKDSTIKSKIEIDDLLKKK